MAKTSREFMGGRIGSLILAFALPSMTTDAMAETWIVTGSMAEGRIAHTATLLLDGRVLVAGGRDEDVQYSSAELYDPSTGTWSPTGSMAEVRAGHEATLLPDGKVLVTGGVVGLDELSSAELYDPSTGTWAPTGSLSVTRAGHTATLLLDGRVLVAGGRSPCCPSYRDSAELYYPSTGTWAPTGSMNDGHGSHTATLLRDGRVLVAAGSTGDHGLIIDTAELYDPSAGTWSYFHLGYARISHTATLLSDGRVLLAAGSVGMPGGQFAHDKAEIYDPFTGYAHVNDLVEGRRSPSATLLPDGTVLVVGGSYEYNDGYDSDARSTAELYDPSTNTWALTGSLSTPRLFHTSTLLPDGRVLVTGGQSDTGDMPSLASAELYGVSSVSGWAAAGTLATARYNHTSTLLPDGRVLAAGGYKFGLGYLASAEVYNQGSWSGTASMGAARYYHTATLLPDGRVLVAGGCTTVALASAEVYDPSTDTWSPVGGMTTARCGHTDTLLPDGRVLVAGGTNFTTSFKSAEVFNPSTNTWSVTGNLAAARDFHTATLLSDGKVLVAGGGWGNTIDLASAELYNPSTGTWSSTGSMTATRHNHTATRLPDGKVLVAGGYRDSFGSLLTAELYNPSTGTWSATDSLTSARGWHTATPLLDGRVLVAGGFIDGTGSRATVEMYDPSIGTWSDTESLSTGRYEHTATLLPFGGVLVVAGYNTASGYLASAEIYNPGEPDGGPPSLSIDDVVATEGNVVTYAVFTVKLSAANIQSVTVDFTTVDGTAIAVEDYYAQAGTLIFNPGEKTKTIPVRVAGNTIAEPDEGFFLDLFNVTNPPPVIDLQGIGTIVDDDPGAGRVSDGSNGAPLLAAKAPLGQVTLTWEASCAGTDTDYEIYEGTIQGSFTDHIPRFCSTNGATTQTFLPVYGNSYFLVVPHNSTYEGSYGKNSSGVERSQGVTACLTQLIEACP
jgi:N-acetylneuraminic acid mutarotase